MACGSKRAVALLAASVFSSMWLSGCDGSSVQSSGAPPIPNPGATPPRPTGTGTLTVSVADPEGRPLANAFVSVFNPTQTGTVGTAETGSAGVATFDAVPAATKVSVVHEFGKYYAQDNVGVAQQGGTTFLAVTLEAGRPRPTVALLPVSISPASVSADRSELTLEVTVVASAAAPFAPAGYGDYSPVSTPAMGLGLDPWEEWRGRDCVVWLDAKKTVPSCELTTSDRYTVHVEEFAYDPVGSAPKLAIQGPAASAMLVLDQSGRVQGLDPSAKRSFAARQFIARTVSGSAPRPIAVAGFAGGGSGAAALPEQPLWVPAGGGTVFSTDPAALEAAVGILEPLVGGSAPVFDALETALRLTATQAPPGNRAVIALLGGGDDGVASDSARQEALAALRRQRDDTGIQSIVIAATPDAQNERVALADLAAALHAPAIALGVSIKPASGFYAQTWTAGVYAALDLAADLLAGSPLPSLSASFRLTAHQPNAFPAGATLRGAIFMESDICPMGCWELPLEFSVEIP
jgi:hypothetical protein